MCEAFCDVSRFPLQDSAIVIFCVNIFVLFYSKTNSDFCATMACVKLKWRVGHALLLREEMKVMLLN